MEITVFGAGEVWLPIPRYEGIYEVSSHGRVRSVDRIDCRGWRRSGKVLATKPSRSVDQRGNPVTPYLRTALSWERKKENFSVHELVLSAFHGPRPEGLIARHLDGDSLNNVVWNLRWGTYAENLQDRIDHGRDHNLAKTHCPQGHPLSGDNLAIYRGARNCMQCKRDSTARSRAKRLAKRDEVH